MKRYALLLTIYVPLLIWPLGLLAQSQAGLIYEFTGGSDGFGPSVGLIQAADGSFYGVAQGGSPNGTGTIFKVTSTGVLTTLHTFLPLDDQGNNAGGAMPTAALVQGPDGNIYGTTTYGGANGYGTLFKIKSSGAFSVIFNFASAEVAGPGGYPVAGLIIGSDGELYGSATYIFKMSLAGDVVTLYNAGGTQAPLLEASDGNFYYISSNYFVDDGVQEGNTCIYSEPEGTTGPCGEIVQYDPRSNSSIDWQDFSGTSLGGSSNDQLTEGPTEILYATTAKGGAGTDGCAMGNTTIYLTCFSEVLNSSYGYSPATYSGLFLAGDGNLYGSATNGFESTSGPSPQGIYQLSTDSMSGTVPPLWEIADGNEPSGILVQGDDGNFYGVTESGGTSGFCQAETNVVGCGAIYKLMMSPALPPPVQVILGTSQTQPGKQVTASMKVLNAFSLTMQQCYAFQNGTPLGKVPGAYNSSTQLYTFSTTLDAPATAGVYNYAVTCGGVESGFATLTVGDTTQTTLTAAPNPVTPPANVTLTATVTRTTGSGVPAGSVMFSSGTTVLGKASLNGLGVATLSASSKGVAAGTYPVIATYSGDSGDVGSVSAAVDVTVE